MTKPLPRYDVGTGTSADHRSLRECAVFESATWADDLTSTGSARTRGGVWAFLLCSPFVPSPEGMPMVCPLSRTSCKRTDFGLFRGMPSGNNSNNNYKGAQLEFRRAAEREYDAFPWNRTRFGCHRFVIFFPWEFRSGCVRRKRGVPTSSMT